MALALRDKLARGRSSPLALASKTTRLKRRPFSVCGEVEDVVGALTPVGRGVAQVFNDLLVELPLLLVAEVEEGEEEEGQEESWEVERAERINVKRERSRGWP